MPKRILHVTLHTNDLKIDEQIEKAIDSAPDWVRYAPDCWLLFTSLSPGAWYKRLKAVIGEKDYLLVVPVDFGEYEGYLSKPVWRWIERHSKKENVV